MRSRARFALCVFARKAEQAWCWCRQVDVSKEEKTVGFDSVLDRVANVRRAVDELESSKKGKSSTRKR